MKEGWQYYFYHNDHLGTPQKMTDVSGAVVWLAFYSSFGKAEVAPGATVESNLRFPGQYYDRETALHYNCQRYYNMITGRYSTSDPITYADGLNLYSYVENRTLIFGDPFGWKKWRMVKAGFSVSALVVGASFNTVWFVSECVDGYQNVKTYIALGIGLTIGLKLTIYGAEYNKGYLGATNFFTAKPTPHAGISVSGPSGGFLKGTTLASATLDFESFADVHALSNGTLFGGCLFNFEGQYYWFRGETRRKCNCWVETREY